MDDERDKLNRFQEAFERGQEGQISNYEAWLTENKINPEKANKEYLTQYFRENPGEAVNHEEELEDVAEYLGFFSQRSNVYHIPVIGVTGVGKTQFLQTISRLLTQIEPGIEQRTYIADSFTDLSGDEERIFEVRDDIRNLEKVLLNIDDCEWQEIETLSESFRVIEQVVDDAVLLTTWTPEFWKHHAEVIETILPTSTEIHLDSFSENDTEAALKQLIEELSDDGLQLPEAYYEKISQFSDGIPGIFTDLLLESLRETFVKELEVGDTDSVDSAAEKLGLQDIEGTVYELSDTKLTILNIMLLWNHRKGIRPSQLVDKLDRDKSTVSYHLKDLKNEGLVTSEKQGRSAYYTVKKQVKPFIQSRISQNGEYYG